MLTGTLGTLLCGSADAAPSSLGTDSAGASWAGVSATAGAFSGTGLQRDPLRTASDSGMYSYADAYPGSRSSTSYMVDVLFTRDAAPLAVVSQTPAPGDPGAAVTTDFGKRR